MPVSPYTILSAGMVGRGKANRMNYSDFMRQRICDIGHRLWLMGFCPSNAGNIVVKICDDEFLCTPHGVSKGSMTPDMILKVDGDLNVLEGCAPYETTSEIRVHIRALQTREMFGATASVHTHAPYCQLYSLLGVPFMEQKGEFVGPRNVPCVPYVKPGTWELADSIIPAMKEAPYVLMGAHGPVTVGKTLEEAFMLMESIEHTAQIAYLLHQYNR